MRSHRQALTVILIALMVAGSAGCGDDASPATSSPISAELADQAEETCAQGRLQGLRFQPVSDAQSGRAALSGAIKGTLLPAMQEIIDKVSTFSEKNGEEASTEAFLTAMQQAVNEAKALDTPTMEATETLLAKPGRLAKKLGLEACVYG